MIDDALCSPRYNRIGGGYANFRREDPAIRAQIHAALGDAKSVVNVGAGAGSYEPLDRQVIAIEPSEVMASQRKAPHVPAIRAIASNLPLHDKSVDAAMSVLSVHHWDEGREAGLHEMRRVARGNVAIVTIDAEVSARMWLMADYLHEVAALDHQIFPDPEKIASCLGNASIEPILLSANTPDWMLCSFWAHPERVLDKGARDATSGFARQPQEVIDRVVADVQRDLADGTWDAKHGHLRKLEAFDAGLRLVVSRPSKRRTALVKSPMANKVLDPHAT